MRFEPAISPGLIVVLAAVAGAVSAVAYLRLRRLTRRGYWAGPAALRAALIGLLALLLLGPYHERQRPDAESFRVAVLADVSGSMRVRDGDGERPRLDVLRSLLDPARPDSPVAQLRRASLTEIHLFAEHAQRLAGGDFDVLPGGTGLGTALAEVAAAPAERPLGAVVVVSDGNSNAGPPVLDEAKRLAHLGLPVTCLGVGRPGPPLDVAVTTAEKAVEGTKGRPLTLTAHVTSTYPDPRTVTVELRDGDTLLDRQPVRLGAGPASRDVAFSVTPLAAGTRVYRFHIVAATPDPMPETDTAHAAIEVRDPDSFQILLLAANLGWEYKFLKLATQAGGQVKLSAVIQAGPGVYRHYGEAFKEDEAVNGLPESFEMLGRFDAVVLDSRAAPLMSPGAPEAFRQFVAARGGGLLVYGPLAPLNEGFRSMLSATLTTGQMPAGAQYLVPDTAVVFPADRAAALALPPGPFLPTDLRFFLAGGLKPGARPALSLAGRDAPLLAVQPYGSGRTALLGGEDTWRWRLASEADADRHTAFWNHLLVWLGSTGKPRLRARFDGARLLADQSGPLQVEALDPDYAPAAAAEVTAILSGPDGFRAERSLAAAAEAPGLYEDFFAPPAPGEYRVDLRARFREGETLEKSAYFLAAPGGVELQSPEYREDVLRDLARVTGGQFHSAEALPRRFQPPVSPRVPVRRERVRWSESWLFLAGLAVTGSAEWFLRRRIGLK